MAFYPSKTGLTQPIVFFLFSWWINIIVIHVLWVVDEEGDERKSQYLPELLESLRSWRGTKKEIKEGVFFFYNCRGPDLPGQLQTWKLNKPAILGAGLLTAISKTSSRWTISLKQPFNFFFFSLVNGREECKIQCLLRVSRQLHFHVSKPDYKYYYSYPPNCHSPKFKATYIMPAYISLISPAKCRLFGTLALNFFF